VSKTLLVIPHFNDVERLKKYLPDLLRTLPAHFAILISDDGSSEDQRRGLMALVESFRIRQESGVPELLPPCFAAVNTGKGGAVYRGWARRDGFSTLAFADADGAVSATEIVRAERFFRSEEAMVDALFASRVKMMGRSIDRALGRHLSGRVFATLVAELTGVPIYDSQCGLKIIKASTYELIEPHLQTQGFAFDVELMLLLLMSGARLVEFPVDWHDVPGSKVHLFRDAIRMALSVLAIQRRVKSLQFDS
jgi:glycosyltransferase involved in cell wall biosynthesis